jgi:HEAT repeat protein
MRILNSTDEMDIGQEARTEIDEHTVDCPLCEDAWRAHIRVSEMRIPDTPRDLYERVIAASEAAALTGKTPGRSGRTAFIGGLVVLSAAAAAVFLIEQDFLSSDSTDLMTETSIDEDPTPSSESAPVDSQTQIEIEPAREQQAVGVNQSIGDLSLNHSAVVVLPLSGTATNAAVTEAAELLHDMMVRRLTEEGFVVYSDEPITQYVVAEVEDVEIARAFGAATLLIIGIDQDTVGNNLPIVNFSFIDAETESTIAGAGIVYQSVEQIEERVLPPMNVDLMTRMIDSVKEHWNPDPQPAPDLDQRIADYTAAVLDPALSDDQRAMALSRLRGAQGTIQQDFIIQAAIAIAENSDNSDIRGRIWQQLKGAGNRYVIQSLLSALENESGEFARREAATVLGEFADDPTVRQALEFSEQNDPSSRVREAAALALMSGGEQDQLIRQRILDRNSTGEERIRALVNPFGDARFGFGPSVAIDDEISEALLEIAGDESTPNRGLALAFLRESSNLELAAPLLEFLTADPEADVRATAASLLASFMAQPGVRAGLQSALDDPDRLVRSAARAALDADQTARD